jgi:(2Fe-2S) ferredoxin
VPRRYQILVCKGPECGDKRHSIDIFHAFERELKSCPLDGSEVTVAQYSCFGRCQKGPNVLVREQRPNENQRLLLLMPTAGAGACLYNGVKPDDARRILDEHVGRGHPIKELMNRG